MSVGGKKNGTAERVRCAVKIGNFSAGFFDQENSRCGVPTLESKFPEAIEAAGGNAGEVERGGAIAPHSVRTKREIVVVVNIWAGLALVYWKPGAEKASGESLHLRDGNLVAVKCGAFSAGGGEEFFVNGIVNDADEHLIMTSQRDGNTEARIAMREVGGAVERVHVPAKFCVVILA